MDTLKTGKFAQRVTERYPIDGAVYSVAVGETEIYLCTSEGLVKLSKDKINTLSSDLILQLFTFVRMAELLQVVTTRFSLLVIMVQSYLVNLMLT